MEQTTTIRVTTTAVTIFSILFLPLLLWGGSLLWHSLHAGEGVLLCIGYLVLVHWVCSPSIELAPGRVGYKTLFMRSQVDLAEVSRVRAGADPAPLLAFHERNGRIALKFRIKLFSKNGLVTLLRHVRNSNPSIQLDPASERMSQADFGPITRETIAARNLLRVALIIGAVTLGGAMIKWFFGHQ